MFQTVQDLLKFSLKASNVLGVGQTALAEDFNDALSALNAMLAVWDKRRWLIYHLIDMPLVSTGAQSYTIGVGGDFNVTRPDRIEAAFFRQFVNSPGAPVDYPLVVMDSREDYNGLTLKSLASQPAYLFYDSGFPMGRVYPWPIPEASVYELHLTIKDTLSGFDTPFAALNVPPEYEEAIWTNLALRLSAIFGTEPQASIPGLARASLETIRGANAQVPRLAMPGGLGGGAKYNIFSDTTY